jgi:hemoglobin-like flavoprotein
MTLSEDDIRLFNDSLDCCVGNPRFLDIFYDRFVGSSGEIAEKFTGTNMARQKRALKASLYTAMLAADGNPPAIEHLERLGHHHAALRIKSEHFEQWRECLITAVRESGGMLDVRTPEVWRAVLDVAIRLMDRNA